MKNLRSVHPFPAKMAPELVSQYIGKLDPGSRVLDPMMGSGTFAIAAARAGHNSVGLDSDPLALVIARTASWSGCASELLEAARDVATGPDVSVNDVLADAETVAFVDYWFDQDAQASLASLASGIALAPTNLQDPLWCALSRLIITKDAGASRARDVSHSRPHVVRERASFDPRERFLRSVELVLSRRVDPGKSNLATHLELRSGDARSLDLPDCSVDAVMTSPPYLTAIDYLRGHRLSLVWMGYSISALRTLRGTNIGSERGSDLPEHLEDVQERITTGQLARRRQRILHRYLTDLELLLGELARVIRPAGTATFVVANSNHQGTEVKVDEALSLLGGLHGFDEVRRSVRLLPDSSRYLPTPTTNDSTLGKRMRSETVLTLSRS